MTTKRKDIYFHASSFGNLMVEDYSTKITKAQLDRITELEKERDEGVNANGNKVRWTDAKIEEYDKLVSKRDAPPKLSKTAEAEVEKVWRFHEKGFVDELNTKQVEKGTLQEEDSIELLSDIDGVFYVKNVERIKKNNISGECDIEYDGRGYKLIIDVKSCWDARTFMNNGLSKMYEYQLRAYMYLYDAHEAELVYTLVDTPKHLIEKEKRQLFFKYKSDDMSEEELTELEMKLQPLYEIIERNHTYSQNKNYSKEERVKRYTITRNLDIEKEMLKRKELALDYYEKISLNQK